jgi:hypothetical protein
MRTGKEALVSCLTKMSHVATAKAELIDRKLAYPVHTCGFYTSAKEDRHGIDDAADVFRSPDMSTRTRMMPLPAEFRSITALMTLRMYSDLPVCPHIHVRHHHR